MKVIEPAAELGKPRDVVSGWCRRGAARRAADSDFTAAADALDEFAGD